MDEKEQKHWEEVRKQGAKLYVIKTTLTGFIICFFTYIFGNAYVNRTRLDKYIDHNLNQLGVIFITCLLSIFFMGIATWVVWIMMENRYKKTIVEINKNQTTN